MERNKKPADRIKEGQVTYEMYAAMPDDGRRYEIIDGVMEAMSPGPTTSHQTVSRDLFVLLQSCRSDYIILYAPLDVILSEKDVLQPDLLMVYRSRSAIVTQRAVEGPPDLVVEIVSPGSRRRDKGIKMKTYAKFGVPEYWLVDSQTRTLEQFLLVDDGVYAFGHLFEEEDTVISDKLPCVSFILGDIFREIPS